MSHLVSQSDYSLLPYIKGTDHNDEENEKYSFLWMQYRVAILVRQHSKISAPIPMLLLVI